MGRRIFSLLFCFFFFSQANTQEYITPYKFKAEFIGGYLCPHDKQKIGPLIRESKGLVFGGELAVEFGGDRSKLYQRQYDNPDFGVALQFLDLGQSQLLGQMVAVYPYINIPLIKNEHLSFNTKLGFGLAYCTKPFDRKHYIPMGEEKDDYAFYNFAIGSYVNAAITIGLNVEVPIRKHLSFSAGIMCNHFSDGSFRQPNAGLNILNASVGLKYIPMYRERSIRDTLPAIGKRFFGEIMVSGGFKQRYYRDTRLYPIGSINIAAYYKTCNVHRVGLGIDTYYSGIYTNDPTDSKRTNITTNELKNKMRLGIDIANDLLIGRFIASLQLGMYIYDPIKNFEPYEVESRRKKGLIYPYDIKVEDGWCYFRVAAKYKITSYLLANVSVKTHLQKSEFIEFGLGYTF